MQLEKSVDETILEYYVISFLYDVFLIMNLSDSGSCDFGNANLWRANANPTRVMKKLFNKILNQIASDKINASAEPFEAIDTERNGSDFLRVRTLPLEKTIQWLGHIRKETSVIPRSSFEKVLFSLLHLTSDNSLSPISVIWLFYGLETLLATRSGENKKAIEERATALLGLDQKQAKKLGKDLQELYNFRSSIVHGGLEITHVIRNSPDDAEEPFLQRFFTLKDFGFSLLIVCIQELIVRGWHSLRFKQILEGETVATDVITQNQ